ncbi:MAG: DUF1826 domain-containing protein [Roseibium sp.]|nr:DUF1826 domain-containing protein [Roseibium sp.]
MSLFELHQPSRRLRACDVIMARAPDILDDIHLPSVAASIWMRSPDAGFQGWIDALPMDQLPELNAVVPVHLAESAVIAACETSKTPDGREQDMLAGDVGALALMMAKILKAEHVKIRLDVSDEVMCPKFHVDNVKARLLCSYRGPGTEYVPEGAETDPGRVRQVPTGSVGLFRGRQWPDREHTGLLHRSPSVPAETGARLLLVIDPVE